MALVPSWMINISATTSSNFGFDLWASTLIGRDCALIYEDIFSLHRFSQGVRLGRWRNIFLYSLHFVKSRQLLTLHQWTELYNLHRIMIIECLSLVILIFPCYFIFSGFSVFPMFLLSEKVLFHKISLWIVKAVHSETALNE